MKFKKYFYPKDIIINAFVKKKLNCVTIILIHFISGKSEKN